MTGDDDDDPIVVIGPADSSDSRCSPDHTSLFTVAASLAVWDRLQSLPGVSLKICSVDSERDIEVFSLSLEVFREFLFCLLEYLALFLSFRGTRNLYYFLRGRSFLRQDDKVGFGEFCNFLLQFLTISELEHDEMIVTRDSYEITERRWDDRGVIHERYSIQKQYFCE